MPIAFPNTAMFPEPTNEIFTILIEEPDGDIVPSGSKK